MALSAEDRICSVCGSGKGILQLSSGETVCSKCIADAGLIRSTARDVPDAAALRADIDRMIDSKKQYNYKEACELAKKTSCTKFDSAVEVSYSLNVDPKHGRSGTH